MNPHYNVVAAVLEHEGKFFCVRRGQTKYPYTSNKYEFPGGKIEPGETEEEALTREIDEELKLKISIKYMLLRMSYDYPDFSVSITFFLCTADSDSKVTLTEHTDSVWASPSEMRHLDWVSADKLIVEEWESLNISSENRSIICLNCGRKFNSLYCPDCGQRRSIRRFDWLEVLRSITRGFFNADRGIFYTVKELFIRPGRLALNYLKGKRVVCFPPFPMMFIFAAAYGLIAKLRDAIYFVPEKATKEAADALANLPPSEKATVDSLATANHIDIDLMGRNFQANGDSFTDSFFDQFPLLKFIYETFSDKFGIIVLLAMPFFILAVRACFGKDFRRNINWPETYIIMAFYYAQCFLIYFLISFISLFTADAEWTSSIMILSSVALLVWYLIDLTPKFGVVKKIWRSVLSYLFFMFILLIVIIILAIIGVSVFAAIYDK